MTFELPPFFCIFYHRWRENKETREAIKLIFNFLPRSRLFRTYRQVFKAAVKGFVFTTSTINGVRKKIAIQNELVKLTCSFLVTG